MSERGSYRGREFGTRIQKRYCWNTNSRLGGFTVSDSYLEIRKLPDEQLPPPRELLPTACSHQSDRCSQHTARPPSTSLPVWRLWPSRLEGQVAHRHVVGIASR